MTIGKEAERYPPGFTFWQDRFCQYEVIGCLAGGIYGEVYYPCL